MRISDAEREQVLAQLNAAVAEGRLTLAEFEERVDGVLRSRTFGEVEPYVGDLPGARPATVPEVLEIRNRSSSLKRQGRWTVPRRLVVTTRSGSLRLDFTEARFSGPSVDIDLEAASSSVKIIIPRGSTADIDGIDPHASSLKTKVPATHDAPGQGIAFRITGHARSSSVQVRYQRRFWRWRW